MYIYENHLFNFYKYHYITNVSVLIMQNLLDILKSLIWLLFWKTKWLLIDNFCQGRIYAPPPFFFLFNSKKKSTYPILQRQSPEILPSIVKQRSKLNRFSESFWSIWMELPHIYTTKVNKQHVQLTEIITKMIIHIGCYIGELTSNANNTLFYMVVSRKIKIR